MRPVFATTFTITYTLAMSEAALIASTLRGSDEVVRDIAHRWGKNLCERCGVNVRSFGVDQVDWDRPMVIAANHQSLFDVPCLMAGLGRSFGFLTKKELFNVPAFGTAIRRLGCVPIDRHDAKSARLSIVEAAERVRGGASIVVFPEGTRSADGRLQPFKKGSFHLVQAAGVPMLPVGITGTSRVLAKNGWMVHAGDVVIRVGQPIACDGDDSAARERLRQRMFEAIGRLIE